MTQRLYRWTSKTGDIKMPSRTASASPILWLDGYIFWRDEDDNGWVCHSALCRLFTIEKARRIRLFSSRRARNDTYHCRLRTLDNDNYVALPEINQSFYIVWDLKRWLRAQIGAGRPHIGVELLK